MLKKWRINKTRIALKKQEALVEAYKPFLNQTYYIDKYIEAKAKSVELLAKLGVLLDITPSL